MLEVIFPDEYLFQGYEEESIRGLLSEIKNIRVYSEREYKRIYEEYWPDIMVVRANAYRAEDGKIFQKAGMLECGVDKELVPKGDSYYYKDKFNYAYFPMSSDKGDDKSSEA